MTSESISTLPPAKTKSSHGARPKVVAILPRGEAIRNFVYTGALDHLAERGDVAVVSIKPNEEIWKLLANSYRELFPLDELRERWLTNFLRENLDLSHGRWLWCEAARERWRLRDQEADTTGKRFKRWAKKLACYPFASRPGLELLSKMERKVSRALQTTNQYEELYKKLKPSLVFNGSHIHSPRAMQAVQAAQWLGIPTATFIFSWDNLTSQGRIMPPYDYYLVWSEGIAKQLLEIYKNVRPEQVFVTGTPQFDFHVNPKFYLSREEFCARVGADPARPIILYSTGMANHMEGEEIVLENIAKMIRSMYDLGRPQLLVRLYAKDRNPERFDAMRRRCPDVLFPETLWETNFQTPKPEDSYLLVNTLRHSALGINVASTVSLELAMFDKPVINVSYLAAGLKVLFDYRRYYEYEHYKPVVDSGGIMVAHDEAQMEKMIRKALTEPQADQKPRRDLIHSMFGKSLDGRAGERVADLLLDLATRKKCCD